MDKYDDTAFHPLSRLRGLLSVTEEYRGGLKRMAPGWVNFVAAAANHFCLHLPEKFPQPWDHFFGPTLYGKYGKLAVAKANATGPMGKD